MSTWSGRRKTIYATTIIIAGIIFLGIPIFLLVYKAPTCDDGVQNGSERGVDCGGSCVKLCSNEFLDLPQASWIKYKEDAPQNYTVAAYVINPNQKVGATDVPYKITFIDKDGFDLGVVRGVFDILPGRSSVVFKTGVKITDTDKKPARAIIDYPTQPQWVIAPDPVKDLLIVDKKYNESDIDSSLEITIKNESARLARKINVYALLKDIENNVLDFSKTIVDEIASKKTSVAPFTWPVSHDEQVVSIEVVLMPE